MPTEVVTFLFTDIQGSARLWERYPQTMRSVLARHDAIIRQAAQTHSGRVYKTLGDACRAVFASAPAALCAAVEAQRALRRTDWGDIEPVRVRMVLHTGPASQRGDDYVGWTPACLETLLPAAHGGQVLLTQAARSAAGELSPGLALRDLGVRHFKELAEPQHIFQLVADDLPGEFPPIRTQDARSIHLPALMNLTIGREAELAAVGALLRNPQVRLVSLTGAGGTGKTRLAIQVATELLDEYEDGICYVDLSPLREPGQVMPAIAQALNVPNTRDAAALWSGVKECLRGCQLLLVLDNFERVLEAAPIVMSACATAPTQLLVTSREALRVPDEHEYPVPPLALPDLERLPPAQKLGQNASVALFMDRAQAIQPSLALTDENAPWVARICARLDGLPLALELAAARTRVLSLNDILARLPHRLALLTQGARDWPERQQTLRRTIDWSYCLLNEWEQTLFARLSVFAGGCTASAAWFVGDSPHLPEGASFPLLLASLVEKNLIQRRSLADDDDRYVMLETIREYALERLALGNDAALARGRHAAYFSQLAEDADPELRGSRQVLWLDRLEREHDNVRAALAWAIEEQQIETALRLCGAVWRFWQIHGYLSEGRAWLEKALGMAAGRPAPPALRVKAINGFGVLAYEQGDLERAQTAFEEALALRRELGDPVGIANSLNNMACVAQLQGQLTRAMRFYKESLALYRQTGDRWSMTHALLNMGMLARQQGALDRAVELLQEALGLHRALGDRRGVAMALDSLGDVEFDRRHLAQARAYYADSLLMWLVLGDKRGLAVPLRRLGLIAREMGDLALAQMFFRECIELVREVGDQAGLADCLECWAQVAILRSQWAHAARVIAAAESIRKAASVQTPHAIAQDQERMIVALRKQMEATAFAAAWADGCTGTVEQLLQNL